jgi:hypothetical protein
MGQTDRATHEAWARMSVKSPRASALLHILVARIGQHNAVVASQSVLAKLWAATGAPSCGRFKTSWKDAGLKSARSGTGTVNAYVINDRVAWHGKRESLRYSLFSATVILAEDEQPDRSELGNRNPCGSCPACFPANSSCPQAMDFTSIPALFRWHGTGLARSG